MLDHPSDPAPSPSVPMDALSEVLQDFRLSGVNYGRCELRHPWGIAFPAHPLLRFHFVSTGPCWLYTEQQGWLELNQGDLVLLPQGIAHRLASAPEVPCNAIKSCQVTRFGGNVCEVMQDGTGPTSTLFSGSMVLGARAIHPLLDLMPPVIRSCDVANKDPVIAPLLEAMTAEASQHRMGGATILSRMADLLTARLIRCWFDCTSSPTTGWLAAIRDVHVGRALAAMHRDPGHGWTVESLAATAGQSRSVFAERFSALLGEGAAHYLTRWRMQLAQEWLGQGELTIAEAASRLGYESEASFARAFKRTTGTSPGAARRMVSGQTDMEFGL